MKNFLSPSKEELPASTIIV